MYSVRLCSILHLCWKLTSQLDNIIGRGILSTFERTGVQILIMSEIFFHLIIPRLTNWIKDHLNGSSVYWSSKPSSSSEFEKSFIYHHDVCPFILFLFFNENNSIVFFLYKMDYNLRFQWPDLSNLVLNYEDPTSGENDKKCNQVFRILSYPNWRCTDSCLYYFWFLQSKWLRSY